MTENTKTLKQPKQQAREPQDEIAFIMMMKNMSKEEQHMALAVITGMNLQKKLESQQIGA